jgi:hypothetical protein
VAWAVWAVWISKSSRFNRNAKQKEARENGPLFLTDVWRDGGDGLDAVGVENARCGASVFGNCDEHSQNDRWCPYQSIELRWTTQFDSAPVVGFSQLACTVPLALELPEVRARFDIDHRHGRRPSPGQHFDVHLNDSDMDVGSDPQRSYS